MNEMSLYLEALTPCSNPPRLPTQWTISECLPNVCTAKKKKRGKKSIYKYSKS